MPTHSLQKFFVAALGRSSSSEVGREWLRVGLETRHEALSLLVQGWLCAVILVDGLLDLGATARNNLGFLDLKHSVHNDCVWVGGVDHVEVPLQLFTVLLVLLVHIEQELLRHVTGLLVLVEKA